MNCPVIVDALRTPIGRARKGSLVTTDAFQLAQAVVSGLLARTRVPSKDIDDIVLAESLQGGRRPRARLTPDFAEARLNKY